MKSSKFWVVGFFEKFITKKSTHHNLTPGPAPRISKI
jgi:hypothetical protein